MYPFKQLCKKHLISMLFLGFFIISVYQSLVVLDPDFGWHYRLGELIRQQGIQYADPFSYSMPHYPVIDHEWLSNSFISVLYDMAGMFGLAVVYSGFVTSALIVSYLLINKQARKYAVIPLLLSGVALLNFVTVRVQLETWFLFSILLFITWTEKNWQKFRLYVPLLFLLWVNMHGGFVYGLLILTIAIVSRSIKKNIQRTDIIVFLLSFFATVCNPYGVHIWMEDIRTLADISLHTRIVEWFPTWYFLDLASWVYISISSLLFFMYRKKFTLYYQLVYIVLLIAGILSYRNLPFWGLVALPITTYAIDNVSTEAAAYHYGKVRFVKAYSVLFLICVIAVVMQTIAIEISATTFQENNGYPQKAIDYIRTHTRPTERIFSPYLWGGYIDWKLPNSKVFIDGRMPSWRTEGSIKGDSKDAFADYIAVTEGNGSFKALVQKYNITEVVWFSDSAQKTRISNSLFALFYKGQAEQATERFLEKVKKMGMKEVYKDSIAVIYRK